MTSYHSEIVLVTALANTRVGVEDILLDRVNSKINVYEAKGFSLKSFTTKVSGGKGYSYKGEAYLHFTKPINEPIPTI